MQGAWDITVKDLRLLVRDKRALVLLVLLPLVFIAIVGMSTGELFSNKDEQRRYAVAIVDADGSELSAKTIEQFRAHHELDVKTFPAKEPADVALSKGDVSAVMVLGPQFSDKVDELRVHDLLGETSQVMEDSAETLDVSLEVRSAVAEGDLIRYFLYGELYRAIFPVVAQKNIYLRQYVNRDAAEDESGAEAAAPAPAEKKPRDNPVFRFLVPGFTVMFVFFLVNIMARSFIAERDHGTLRRLRLAPISSASVLVGKTCPFYICSVVQTSLLFLCGRVLFQMSWGPEPVYLIPVILCTSAAATALGLLLATCVQTDQQVSAYGTSLVLILGGVSGCFIPRAWLPDVMKALSLATPHAWALKAFDAVLTPAALDSILVLDYCGVLLVFAAVFFFAGWQRFRYSM